MDTLDFRTAEAADLPHILEIIRAAQRRMGARGSDQWQDGYPAAADIAGDIASGRGYVLCDAERTIVAYGAVLFDGEPAYETIAGAWPDAEPYVAVHRLAVAEERLGQGLARHFLHRTERLARTRGIVRFRIDTHFDNGPMLRTLEQHGFIRCGTVRYPSGERVAFWKRIE